MRFRLCLLGVGLLMFAGCGSSEHDAAVAVEQAVEEAQLKAGKVFEAQEASYGEASGCLPMPDSAVEALLPRRELKPGDRRKLLRFGPEYSAVRGAPIKGIEGDMAEGTYYASFVPIDGGLPAVALSERAFKTGKGTVLGSRVVRQLKSTDADANRARACALKRSW